jgi:DNA-binding MarR family transcriptional regulator
VSRRNTSHPTDPTKDLLEAIEARPDATQRSLASRIGIALGLTNLLVQRFVAKGWIRVTRVQPHRVRYLLTPAGLAEKARLSQQAFLNSVERYRSARLRLQEAFDQLSAEWSEIAHDTSAKRIVFYGSGELAEIGYICLQETDLQLVGVIDEMGRTRFFGLPVVSASAEPAAFPAQFKDARILVMSMSATDQTRANLSRLGLADRATWI